MFQNLLVPLDGSPMAESALAAAAYLAPKLHARVTLPAGTPGDFVWKGVRRPLQPGSNTLTF